MKIKEFFDSKFSKYGWYHSFTGDYGFRTLVMAIGATLLNMAFAGVNGATAVKYSSLWYGAFAAYYVILVLQRIFVLISFWIIKRKFGNDSQKFEREKQKIYLANGAIFVPLDIALATIAGLMTIFNELTATGEIMAISTAAYAFYKIIMAIINIVKAKKADDAIIQTLRNIGFVDALTSMLVLETTLISTFGELDKDMRMLISLTSISVCVFVVALGIFMIVKSINKMKKGKTDGREV